MTINKTYKGGVVMNQLKVRKGISHIYFGLKNNKCSSANIRFNKFFTYNKILEDNKNYISKLNNSNFIIHIYNSNFILK